MAVRVVTEAAVIDHATRAAQEYVRATRELLSLERDRRGEAATGSRRYQRLEQSLTPSAIRRCWPAADLHLVLGDGAESRIGDADHDAV